MTSVRHHGLALSLLLGSLLAYPIPSLAQNRLVMRGTGGMTGVYYTEGGSVASLDALEPNTAGFAVLQSNVQFKALQDLSAPLHPGALRYDKERGWL